MVAWKIVDPAGKTIASSQAVIAPDGTLKDSTKADGFGLTAGVTHQSGKYQVDVATDAGTLVTSEFSIID